MKSQDIIISPQQQCSKSYMDRHVETLTQSKGFRRRHNSCEYVFCVLQLSSSPGLLLQRVPQFS